jgi:DNA-cytosine methyltransferase
MPVRSPDPDPITVLDLFAGCGGLTEGFHQYRPNGAKTPLFRSVGAVEWEPAAAASYAANFGAGAARSRHFAPPEIFCRDIVGWEPPWDRGDVDVVVGGPPCQGFSALNRLKVRAERNTLWQEFIRVVVVLQPKVFVIENVDRFIRSAEFEDLKRRMGQGDLSNYQLVDAPGAKRNESDWERARHYLLNAADYGSPQARRRAIVMGVRTDAGIDPERLQYPAPTHSRDVLLHGSDIDGLDLPIGQQPWRTVDDLFEETARLPIRGTELRSSRASRVGGLSKELAGPFTTGELHVTRAPEASSLARYRAIPAGGNRKDLRGRYRCVTAEGRELIIEKVGTRRLADGRLAVPGTYAVVVDGKTSDESVSIAAVSAAPSPSKTGRSSTEVFFVEMREHGRGHRATLQYLSTAAWDDHDTGAGDVMGRVRLGSPSVTIRTEFFKPEKGRYLHPSANRPITHYEAARLQGFPEDFKWCGSKTDIAKQIGNAVPIPLGTQIAASIHEYLRPASD